MNIISQDMTAAAKTLANSPIGVVGTGVMGRGIAQLFAASGSDVLLFDVDEKRAEDAVKYAGEMIERDVAKGKMTAEAARAASARLKAVSSLAMLSRAGLVIEAIVEDMAAKQELFRALEEIVSEDCILATNTSSLLVTEIASSLRSADRVCGIHFFNPVPLMKVAEVIGGARTRPDVVETAASVIRGTGHAAVVASDSPGFLVNHAGRGLYTEGLRIVSEGVATVADIDAVMREAAGFRMGPFELFDLTGLDVSFKVLNQIYHQFYEEPRFKPQPLIARQYSAGLYGRKVGRGFYVYKDGKQEVPARPERAKASPRTIWLAPTSGDISERVRRRIAELGLPLSTERRPAKGDIVVVTPVGKDATSCAVAEGVDPERTLGIDPLFGLDRRFTVMSTPVTRAEYRDSLCDMLAAAGMDATPIHDSAGFIAQRVTATIVNISCEIAQQRIANPADIDLAVRIALGYPAGPLSMGECIGPRVVLEILEQMYDFYGDPRYRPSPWLKRRALLARPLTTVEA